MWLEYDAPHRAVKGLDCYQRQPDPNRACRSCATHAWHASWGGSGHLRS
jgi:hypothetical protein